MLSTTMPSPESFVEVPGMRGLRIARVGQADGTTLEIVDAVKGVVIPAMTHPSAEQGRVLSGSLRFFQGESTRVLNEGDTWDLDANVAQGPHVVLEDNTRVAILRKGRSALDVE